MKTAKEIYDGMVSVYEASCGKVLADDCDMAIRMYAAAAEIEGLYIYNDWVKKQCFPQSAEGEYLDGHARMRGITRNEACAATGKIRFCINEAVNTDINIDAGMVCITDGGIYFETTEAGTIKAGELYCEVSARARNAGRSGNVTKETIVHMVEAPIGVSYCINMESFSGGVDGESDESLRKRVLDSYKTLPNGANKAYYEKTVLGVDGVGAVVVLPKKRGLGTIDIILSATEGMPDEALLSKVTDLLNSMREICVDIKVAAPETLAVNVAAAIDIEDGYVFENVRANVETAVRKFFNGTLLGKDVTVAKLGNIIYSVEGVRNYTISSPSGDVSAAETELPLMGTITINGWGQ